MLPPIVVDLGPNVAPVEVQYVLDACNDVVHGGECVAEGSQGLIDAPRALASARNVDRRGREVRIEVRLTDSEQGPLVRVLRFTPRDPARDRWRSVGLAIATLVGEGQRAEEAEAAAEAARAEQAPPAEASTPETEAPAAAPPPPPPPPPAPASEPVAATVVIEDEREPVVPLDGVYLGAGVLAGPGLDDGSGRVGVSLRGGWASPGGFSVLGSASYSVRAASGDELTVSWLSLEAGAGYRLWLTDSFTAGVNLQAGVQQLRFEAREPVAANERGDVSSTSVLNPLLSLGVDGWWLPWQDFAFWLALDAHTIFRKSELFVADTLSASTPAIDFTGLIGVGWRIR